MSEEAGWHWTWKRDRDGTWNATETAGRLGDAPRVDIGSHIVLTAVGRMPAEAVGLAGTLIRDERMPEAARTPTPDSVAPTAPSVAATPPAAVELADIYATIYERRRDIAGGRPQQRRDTLP